MSNSAGSLTLLSRTAELRASGTPWSDTAKELTVGHDELRQLVADHAREYERLARRARNEVLCDTLCAAIGALRNLLKSADERISFMAASTITRYKLTCMRLNTIKLADRLSRRAQLQQDRVVDAPRLRAQNVSESTEVSKNQEVAAAKKVAQTSAPMAVPAGQKLAPPVSPSTATNAPRPVAPAPGSLGQPSLSLDAARRKQRLVDRFASGPLPGSSLVVGDRPVCSWLTE